MSDEALDHPRSRYALQGVETQAASLCQAMARGRLHHAWLLGGPQGLGKASFAFRAARRLLGAAPDPAYGALGASPDDPVCRLIASRSHPDLLVLERALEGTKKVIPVEEARRLPEFFSKAPALGACRVAIVDSVDDLNASGANALLKTLEEPSGNGVLLLVSHAPGRLLPTIRSRCRTLRFNPWPEAAVAAVLQSSLGLEAAAAERIAPMSAGSPGRAASLARAGALELDAFAQALVEDRAAGAPHSLLTFAEGLRGQDGAGRFGLLVERICAAARARAGGSDQANGVIWAEFWERAAGLPSRTEGLNLDRQDAFWALMTDLAEVRRRSC